MSIHFEHSVDVLRSPEQVFTVINDFARTPSWLERCTGLEKLSPGPNAVGTKLRYAYREGSHTGVMEGEITARVPDERLTCHYRDKLLAVTVDFRMTPTATGTRLTHAIEIVPQTLIARLMSPLIKRHLPAQTTATMERLKSLIEAETGSNA